MITSMHESKRLKISKKVKGSDQNSSDFNKETNIVEAYNQEKQQNQILTEKVQRLITKNRILVEAVKKGDPQEQILKAMVAEITATETKILELQQSIHFRTSAKMKDLRESVYKFLQAIHFEVDNEDLQQISDEVELILLLMDIFQTRYNEVLTESAHTEQLIEKMKRSEEIGKVPNRNTQSQTPSGQVSENKLLKQKIEQLEEQITVLTSLRKKQIEIQHQNPSQNKDLQHSDDLKQQQNIKKYRAKINELESEITLLQIEIQKLSMKVQEEVNLRTNAEIQAEQNEVECDRLKAQCQQLKQRYTQMQQEKNDRIKILTKELKERMSELQVSVGDSRRLDSESRQSSSELHSQNQLRKSRSPQNHYSHRNQDNLKYSGEVQKLKPLVGSSVRLTRISER